MGTVVCVEASIFSYQTNKQLFLFLYACRDSACWSLYYFICGSRDVKQKFILNILPCKVLYKTGWFWSLNYLELLANHKFLASHPQLLLFFCLHLSLAAREADKYRQVPVEDYCTELFFNRNIILLLKNRIKLFCWLRYLNGILLLPAAFSSMKEMLTIHIIGFSWRGWKGLFDTVVSKFLQLRGISGASFGYLVSQMYGKESLLIIWFTA